MKREHGTVDVVAARQALAFMRSLARRRAFPKGDKWSRESLYEDRIKKALGTAQGWLPDGDPFFTAVEEIVSARPKHRPRTLRKPRSERKV